MLEYFSAEVLELVKDATRDNQRLRIAPRHVLLAIQNDEELAELLADVTICQGDVLSASNETRTAASLRDCIVHAVQISP